MLFLVFVFVVALFFFFGGGGGGEIIKHPCCVGLKEGRRIKAP